MPQYFTTQKDFSEFGTGSAFIYWHKKERKKERKRVRKMIKKMNRIEMVEFTGKTTAVVKNGKVLYLIQNGRVTQDPLKVRYFQRMI